MATMILRAGLRKQVPARYYSGAAYQEPQKSAVSQGAIRKKNLAALEARSPTLPQPARRFQRHKVRLVKES